MAMMLIKAGIYAVYSSFNSKLFHTKIPKDIF